MAGSSKSTKVTPLMKQYFGIKTKYPDALLLFRVGDFYETFGDDAVKTAEILNIVLTSRNNGGSDIALAGFPHHSLDVYMPKLVKAGYRVAICDQLEKPSKEKKIVKRGVTEIVTPGLTLDDKLLDRNENNFLASIHYSSDKEIGISFLDISTGEFYVSEGNKEEILNLLDNFKVSEIVFAKSNKSLISNWTKDHIYPYALEDWIFTYDYAREKLLHHFKTNSLKGFGIENMNLAQVAAGAIMQYLDNNENKSQQHLLKIQRIESNEYVWLDRFTIRNLELIEPNQSAGTALIDVLDYCISPMGSRMLRKWISMPLVNVHAINQRLESVQWLYDNNDYSELDQLIKEIGDLERLISKVSSRKINPREIVQLKRSLLNHSPLKSILTHSSVDYLIKLAETLNECAHLVQNIDLQINDEAPVSITKGDVIKTGFSEKLDEYRFLIKNNKQVLIELQQREIQNTGISSLKIGFNNVFGYYLEVTNKYKDQGLIPDGWIRKQTLKSAERYITEELKVIEEKILNAEEIIQSLETSLFEQLVTDIQAYIEPIQINAHSIAKLDCLMSFAKVASKNNYNRPTINDSHNISIIEGRHPVIECQLKLGESYVPNNIELDIDDTQLMLITGPNMSGKSALLRQTALICLMAQMGSFVPANQANIGLLDKVFTRVGASDNLSQGESTFMVEMNETAGILNNISNRSLILLDEIGRGTSTYDGISIAWSIAEYLHNNGEFRPKTLFATHYHELSQLEDSFDRIKNFCIDVQEIDDKIIFLRKLIAGSSQHSFGIHVAQMAGMPKAVIRRAKKLLKELESRSFSKEHSTEVLQNTLPTSNIQLQIFDQIDPRLQELQDDISDIDINALTPVEALLKLQELKKILKEY